MPINRIFPSENPETTQYWWTTTQHTTTMEPINPRTTPISNPKTLFHPHHHHQFQYPNPNFWPDNVNSLPFPQNSPNLNFNLNREDDDDSESSPILPTDEVQIPEGEEGEGEEEAEKEPMFEKPLTPSDVGKLNRLVIPKQYAEKYFPLAGGGGGGGGGESGDKGLLLSFEDEAGKCWRFRYSYWNSSQSYVLTKGWSRFVKEKRLDAGDVVLFERRRPAEGGDRLFIGWRRRAAPVHDSRVVQQGANVGGGGGGGVWTKVFYPAHPYPAHQPHGHGPPPPLPYQQPDYLLPPGAVVQRETITTPSANSKRLRLFGVNMECQPQDHLSHPAAALLPPPPPLPQPHNSSSSSSFYHPLPSPRNHMDMNFSRDVNQMRYRQG